MRRAAAAWPGARHRGRAGKAKNRLLVIAAIRTVAALVALALLPVLYRHDFLVLVALRPSLGVLTLTGTAGLIAISALLTWYVRRQPAQPR